MSRAVSKGLFVAADLNMRYKHLPSRIAAGHNAAVTAFPIVAHMRLLLERTQASSNHQYIWLNDTLVAPIWNNDSAHDGVNVSSRSVWVLPGTWTDAWTGEAVTGPKNVTVSQPVERIPLWHRQGGLTILASEPTLRVDDQDWSELTLEAFPHVDRTSECPRGRENGLCYEQEHMTWRTLVDRGEAGARTTCEMRTFLEGENYLACDDCVGEVHFAITAAEDNAERGCCACTWRRDRESAASKQCKLAGFPGIRTRSRRYRCATSPQRQSQRLVPSHRLAARARGRRHRLAPSLS